ncbi:ABC transporter ATP-binding protein [Salidesulfovibrio onnuriiensis]|uniref:ABC transporter ATP-binding protein n=1 Tax=Salidesulfovibrio onnuriiensis TaxID=2583823 RepID=UPI0011C86D4F|nr:ABC transporter ATP-binding protein [Salidesulfovibrio onnuriiensis]
MFFRVDGLVKSFGRETILDHIGFEVDRGEIVSLIGPSGVGKTTLLNIIAGLEKPDSGSLHFSVPPSREHPVIMVFQDYVLFPNLTVFENVAFGLRVRKISGSDVRKRVMEILSYFQLAEKQGLYPNQLSAGQRQRVAIARAMVVNPAMLLLDEPFANLDRNLKMQTAEFIRDTQKEFGVTTISVTHDLEEAFVMSDRIGLILEGRLVQYDTAAEVYGNPATMEAARFMGPMNVVRSRLVDPSRAECLPDEELYLRPEAMTMVKEEGAPGVVVESSFAGHYTKYRVRLGEDEVVIFDRQDGIRPGDRVHVRLAENAENGEG